MPLFPIVSDDRKEEGDSNDKTSLLTTSTPAGLSASQDWLQVGQSYSSISSNHGVTGDESDQGSKVSKQKLYPLPPKDKAQATKAVLDARRSSRMPLQTVARRHKAVGVIGRDDSSPSVDDSIPESKLASASESESEVVESGKKKGWRSYSSDGSPNNTTSGLDGKTKHAKTSRQERRKSESEVVESGKKKRRRSYSSDGSPNNTTSGLDGKTKHAKTSRQERRKVKELRKKKTSRISRKSERKSRHRGDSRRHGSRSRKEIGSSSSDGDFGECNLEGPTAAVRRSKSGSRHYQDQPKLFVEDRQGDQDNISFEGFYRTDVPIYHGMKNFARNEGGRRAGEKGRAPLIRYFSRQARGSISDERVARVQLWRGIKRQRHRLALETNTADVGGGKGTHTEGDSSSMPPSAILPLQAKHDPSARSRSQEQSPGADFLPVDPTVVAISPSNEDTGTLKGGDPAHTLDVGAPTESLEQWVTRRTKEFNRLTREQPKSENLWLKFADFQEEAVRAIQGGGEFVRSPSSAVVHTTLEKRASVLEGALRRNPTSVKLRKAQLHVAGQLHEHDAVDSLWKKAIEKSNHSLALWLRYLHFKAGHFASFSVEEQRSTFSLCIEALECRRREARQAREKDEKARGVFIMGDRSMLEDGKEHVRAEKELLDVLWSYCVMERAAGYHERALGALQAMVELNITSRDKPVSVDDLEAFWESEFPRIGDAHPSMAGISQWREASLTRNDSKNDRSRQEATSSTNVSSASIVQVPSGERAAVGRKLPVVKALDARGKRKRAVDFFSEDAPAPGVPTPGGQGERHTPLWRMRTGLSNPSKGDSDERVGVTYVEDVLEKAYQAAEALSSKTTAFQSADGDLASSPLSRDASRGFDTDGEDAPDRAPLESVVGPENRLMREETMDDTGGLSISSISSKTRNTRERQLIEEIRQGPIAPTMQGEPVPRGKPGPAPQDEARDERRGGNDGHCARAVEADGLIWVDESQATAYSVRHGYRINVQGAQDSMSGLEYGRILNQVRGDAKDDRGGNATTAAARERIRYEEMAKEATVQEDMLEDVPESDPFSSWATSEDRMTREQWQPLRATVDEDGAAEQPDRVVFVEDIRPLLSTLSHPASLGTLVNMLVSVGGLVFPRSNVSHSHKFMSEACSAASLGDGGLAGSLISAVSDGLQAVWKASGAELPVSGRSVVRCTGRPGSLPPPVVCTTADQFLLLTDELVGDVSRQKFMRNVLHHLIRAPQSSPRPSPIPGSTNSSGIWSDCGDMLVQLQCTLVLFEGYLASAAGAYSGHYGRAGAPGKTSIGSKGGKTLADNESYGHEARKVAKSLLEASQASATDLRLWSSYVQLLAILGNRDEAIKVAEKALSLVEALPESKKSLSAEMFWIAFRLHAGLPLNPRDPHAGEEIPSNGTGLELLANLFNRNETRNGKRQMALLLLCSFAEGRFDRSKKPKKLKRDDKDPEDGVISPPRLMAARKLMADRVARLASQLPQGKTDGVSSLPQCHSLLDMTPPFMYHSVAWVWMEYLSRGPDEAEHAMSECLAMVKVKMNATNATQTNDSADDDHFPGSRGLELRGAVSGNKPYEWDVVLDGTALGVCLERMHRSFSELVMLAQRFDPVKTGPRRVRMVLLRGLQSCPAEPGMLCMLMATEQFSGSQQRLVHHLSEVARRRALDWEQGPTPFEWILSATHQVMRCVHEARHVFVAPEAAMEKGGSASNESTRKTVGEEKGGRDRALCVKKWLPGSYARLRRSMEKAVTHATGRQMTLLWRMYMSLEAMRGNHKQAKQLFWRAIHACPGNKALWMDSLRGDQRAHIGSLGLRPAFRAKELQEISDAMLEKSLHVRAEPV